VDTTRKSSKIAGYIREQFIVSIRGVARKNMRVSHYVWYGVKAEKISQLKFKSAEILVVFLCGIYKVDNSLNGFSVTKLN
jgi:hypothetical protein